MPDVSVVIPTFGRAELLKRAIESVLCQTMANLEVIVVVDGDDPATIAMLNGLSDPRLRVIVQDYNKGAGVARDTGAAAARGVWVAFLDDDDEWLPQKLEKQLAAVSGRPAIMMTLSHVVTPEGTFVRPLAPYDAKLQTIDEWIFDRTTWLKGGLNFLQTSSLMMQRTLFETLNFPKTIPHEDWEFVIRAVKQHGYSVETVAEPLVIHYVGQQRPSLSKMHTWRNSVDWADRMGDLLTPRAYSGMLLTSIGQTAANHGAYGAVWPLLSASFRNGRPTAKQLFRFAMCWLVPRGFRRRARAKLQGTATAAEASS